MFNDDIIIGEFTEGTPAARWPGHEDESLWRRIEQYIVWRWGERPVEWLIRGPGLFLPPLKPVNVTAIDRYSAGQWLPQGQIPTPFGVDTPPGYYRIRGVAGKNETPPADVLEAYTRMAEYTTSVKEDGRVGAMSVSDSVGGVTLTVRRSVQAMARALEYSGAADLLKAYRHV